MESCNGCHVPVNKGHPLSNEHDPQIDLEVQKMVKKLYASLVGSLMYANIYTKHDIAYIVEILGKFQSSPIDAH